MFPLKSRKLIRGAAAHIAAGLGAGADYVADKNTPLYSPFDGKIEVFSGSQGGNWSRLIRKNGDRIEFAHLERYVVSAGEVKAGQLIAYTGNTGSITTGPHKHIQIFRDGKRLDPEAYNWEDAIIPPMNCETEKKEIQKLNFEIGTVTKQRDDAIKAYKLEVEGHQQTLSQLKTSQAEVTKIETEMKANQVRLDIIRKAVL